MPNQVADYQAREGGALEEAGSTSNLHTKDLFKSLAFIFGLDLTISLSFGGEGFGLFHL